MSGSHQSRIIVSVVLAVMITGAVYYLNTQKAIIERSDFALRLAQQITTQTETLMARAHDRLESHPIEWAVQALAVGPEFKPVQMAPFKINPSTIESEKYRLNNKTGVFSYLKVLNPETGEGIRIHIQVGYVGLFGAAAPWQSDFFALLVFALILALSLQLMGISRKPPQHEFEIETQEAATDASKDDLTHQVSEWASEAKTVLILLGNHILNMIKEAQSLAKAAGQSREKIELLSQTSAKLRDATVEMENAMVDGEENSTKFRENLTELKVVAEESAGHIDAAFQSYDNVFTTTHDLNGFVSQAKEALLAEAKLLQNLKEKILPNTNQNSD